MERMGRVQTVPNHVMTCVCRRFNIVLVDERVGNRPALPAGHARDRFADVRGAAQVGEDQGLFPVFEAIVSSL